MTSHRFALIYQLAPEDADADAIIERFGAAGQTDALIGAGAHGRLALNYHRSANSPREALQSAMADAARLIPGARLLEASPLA